MLNQPPSAAPAPSATTDAGAQATQPAAAPNAGATDPGAQTTQQPAGQETAQPGQKTPAKPADGKQDAGTKKIELGEKGKGASQRIKQLLARNKELAQAQQPAGQDVKPWDPASGKPEDHPMVARLRKDGQGKVLLRGEWVSPQEALDTIESDPLMGEVTSLQKALAERDKADKEGERRAQMQQLNRQMWQSLEEATDEMVGDIPLPDGQHGKLRDRILTELEKTFPQDAMKAGLAPDDIEGRGELMMSRLVEIANDFALMIGGAGAEQIRHNKEYADKYSVAPGGEPGVAKPVDFGKMSPGERTKHFKSLEAEIENEIRAERQPQR